MRLVADEDFAQLYSEGKGRPSIPPSVIVRAMLCATHDRLSSDREMSRRTRVDADWKAAMGVDDAFEGIAPLRSSTVSGVVLSDRATGNRHIRHRFAVKTPNRVGALMKLWVYPGDELAVDGAPPSDHRVGVMATTRADGAQVDFLAEAFFVRVQDQGADITANVEDQRLGRTVGHPVIDEWPFLR